MGTFAFEPWGNRREDGMQREQLSRRPRKHIGIGKRFWSAAGFAPAKPGGRTVASVHVATKTSETSAPRAREVARGERTADPCPRAAVLRTLERHEGRSALRGGRCYARRWRNGSLHGE